MVHCKEIVLIRIHLFCLHVMLKDFFVSEMNGFFSKLSKSTRMEYFSKFVFFPVGHQPIDAIATKIKTAKCSVLYKISIKFLACLCPDFMLSVSFMRWITETLIICSSSYCQILEPLFGPRVKRFARPLAVHLS